MGGKKPMNVQHNRGTWSHFPSHHHATASPMAHDSYALSNTGGGMLGHSTGLAYDVGLLDLGPHPSPSVGGALHGVPGGALHGAIGSTRSSSAFYAEEHDTQDIDMKVMELVDVIGMRMRRQLKPMVQATSAGRCSCSDDVAALQSTVAAMQQQIQQLLQERDKPATPAVDQAASPTVSALSDRVSTLEGRQSAFQSQMAQLCKSLGTVPTGKNAAGKPGGIALPKPLLQELRDEFDQKLAAATVKLETAMNKQMSSAMSSMEQHILNDIGGRFKSMTAMQYDDILSLVASETDMGVQNTKQWFEDRCAQEAKHRMGLEARMMGQFDAHAEWLQQLEGLCGSWHASQTQVESLATQVAQLQKKAASTNTATSPGNHAQALSTDRMLHQIQTQMKHVMQDTKNAIESVALMETRVMQAADASDESKKKVAGLQKLVEKMMRDQGSVESMLQQYVSTITHQVASVTRQYVSVRIRDNNRLLDATLRARIPAYVENEHENFMLVRPNTNSSMQGSNKATPELDVEEAVVLRDSGGRDTADALLQSVLKLEIDHT
ncbi:hypothetical protein, variant 1 [Aphanomyces invadans]|uniref:Uncharacterized protein n=1 Tax=Aphanomyces invadans TaxID=157072 RepID=A0A024TDK4_9STRA|nr:hypothetical protein, variant 1 [Aphanomyces invadans]ETV91387.1 hypothetical protein, variant 1 [Aphanomyces invadans]|eukprot:XP_008880015.1 hypothetical protein, variant 1 [Aphanomyces invadans]